MPGSRDAGLILNLNLLPGGTAKGSWYTGTTLRERYGLAPHRLGAGVLSR